MKLIIDIPEETVNEIRDNAIFASSIPSDIRWDVTNAIVNGTPLNDIKDAIVKEIEENVLADDPNTLLTFLKARETCVAVIQQKIHAINSESER